MRSQYLSGHTRRRLKMTVASVALLTGMIVGTGLAYAGPDGGVVVSGAADIAHGAGTTVITQTTGQGLINWDGFDVGKNESVTFIQPDSASFTMNRVISSNPTTILGHISANGGVGIINANGVVFGQGATVDVSALVASTADISNSDFNAGNYRFNQPGKADASIINDGTITVKNAGLAAFVSPTVINNGIISAKLGTVQLVAGDTATLDLYGDGLVELAVTDTNTQKAIYNSGTIEGSTILITATAGNDVVNSVVNMDGVVTATSALQDGGRIVLGGDDIVITGDLHADGINTGDGGTIEMIANKHMEYDGTVTAKGGENGGDGGFVEVSGKETLHFTGDVDTSATSGETGTLLLDPQNLTVAASGGDITGTLLSSLLGSNDVELESSSGGTSGNGDIIINDAVAWGQNRLTLTAARNIEINDIMSAMGTAGVTLNSATTNGADSANTDGVIRFGLDNNGFSGRLDYTASGNFIIGGTVYTVINSLGLEGSTTGTDLQGINGDLTGNYVLGSSIDASTTANWNYDVGTDSNLGFNPLGDDVSNYTGNFYGLGHTIDGLVINRQNEDYVGLFGYTKDNIVANLGLTGITVSGNSRVGGFSGDSYGAMLIDNYVTGNINGAASYTGGMLGSQHASAKLLDSYANVTIYGVNYTGGLVGYSYGNGEIINSYSVGEVHGEDYTGGLLGRGNSSAVSNSYSTASVYGENYSGGMIGYIYGTTVSNSYAEGDVRGILSVGGFIGNVFYGSVIRSYASGGVTGTTVRTGGLVGQLEGVSSSIETSYATGNVSGHNLVGGLVGLQTDGGTISDSYAMGEVHGDDGVGGLVGYNNSSAISRSFATGKVSGGVNLGGLIGDSLTPTVNNSFWDTQTSEQGTSSGGIGLTTAQMQDLNSYSTWNIDDASGTGKTWRIYDGYTYPLLRLYLTPLTVSLGNSAVYTGVNYDASAYASYVGFINGDDATALLGTLNAGGSARDVGTYTSDMNGLYSAQDGYDIAYSNSNFSITSAPLTVTANNLAKDFNADDPVLTYTVDGLVGTDTLAVFSGALTRDAGEDAGDYAVTLGNLSAGSNYQVTFIPGTLTINQSIVLPVTVQPTQVTQQVGSTTNTPAPAMSPVGMSFENQKAFLSPKGVSDIVSSSPLNIHSAEYKLDTGNVILFDPDKGYYTLKKRR